jgi:putative addiction module killer protein
LADSTPWTIEHFETKSGIRPFAVWFESLRKGDPVTAALVDKRLSRLKFGHLGDYDNVGDGVIELRNFYGPGYRLYVGRIGATVYLLLLGGSKGSQNADIKQARDYFVEFKGRKGKEDKK